MNTRMSCQCPLQDRTRPPRRAHPAAFVLLLASFGTQAQQFEIGTGADCDTASIQTAINSADSGYTLRISNSASYSAQALDIQGKNLHLIGGYETCTSPTPSGLTTLSGQGGSNDSVITIRGTASVTLENLIVIRGDEGSDFYGGGVDYSGSGRLTLKNTALAQNYAGYGGGMSVESAGGAVVVDLQTGTVIQSNTAQYSGGGIRIEGEVTLNVNAPQTWIANNTALGMIPGSNEPRYGNGGGVQILAPARANIGSPGYGNSGVIFGNSARYGGGVAIDGRANEADQTSARLNLFTTDRTRPTRIHGNTATRTGGGIHLLPDSDLFFPPTFSGAEACLWDARIDDNQAQNGAAIYGDSSFQTLNNATSGVYFNPTGADAAAPVWSPCGGRPAGLGAVGCAAGTVCSSIDGNLAQDGAQASGAIVLVQDEGELVLRGISLRQNLGTSLIHALPGSVVRLHDLLISGGSYTGAAIRMETGRWVPLSDSTIAGNFIGGTHVVSTGGDIDFARNIVWQPGRSVLAASGSITLQTSIVNSLAGLPSGPDALVLPPRFVDPLNNDFDLRAASPAVDFAPAVVGDDRDAFGGWRDVDLPIKANARGPRDIGARERQSLQPLALNGNFDGDLRLWPEVDSGGSFFDGSQNLLGASGSGSLGVNTTALVQQLARVRSQCIHLPGPGLYRLNGYGRSVGSQVLTRDQVGLEWHFRRNGGEACEDGVAERSGVMTLSQSTSWTSAATPADILVSEAEWTSNSSITIVLIVKDNSVSGTPTAVGWFDGISLNVQGAPPANAALFADGFE